MPNALWETLAHSPASSDSDASRYSLHTLLHPRMQSTPGCRSRSLQSKPGSRVGSCSHHKRAAPELVWDQCGTTSSQGTTEKRRCENNLNVSKSYEKTKTNTCVTKNARYIWANSGENTPFPGDYFTWQIH